jgi:GntR family transcriptional repressor for pyruvate dehydrogenase complex
MAATPDTRKLYQQVASAIMASIVGGSYKPGERLPSERDLAVAYKVSRPTIREAMIALEIRGLAESRHGSGIYVTDQPPTQAVAADLDIGAFELTEARRLFEGEAAALAATTITDAELDEMEAVIGEMVDENARKQKGEVADRRFHVAIARATRNTAITAVVEQLWDMRHKSPLCIYMLERARCASVTRRERAKPCAITWRELSKDCWRRPRAMPSKVHALRP